MPITNSYDRSQKKNQNKALNQPKVIVQRIFIIFTTTKKQTMFDVTVLRVEYSFYHLIESNDNNQPSISTSHHISTKNQKIPHRFFQHSK